MDHVLTEGLVDMLPLHCPALPKNGPGALQAVLRDPFVLLLELLRQTCGPGGTDGKRAVYADDLRTLLLVRCIPCTPCVVYVGHVLYGSGVDGATTHFRQKCVILIAALAV